MALLSQKDEKFRQEALNGNPLKVILTFCGPLALFQALQSIFKILDALMASHIGADAVSAVAVLSQITLMINALGSGLAVGGSIKISEAYGQGDYEAVSKRVSTLYTMAVIVSLAVAGILIPFAEPFLRLLNTPEALIETGVGYFRIEILTLVVNFFNTVYIAISRSRGQAGKILMLNMATIVVKLGFSAYFVYVVGSGVTMIAVATLLGQLLMLFYALWSMNRDEGIFRFSRKNIQLRKDTVVPVLKLAYPVSMEKLFFAAGKVIVNSMAGVYDAMAAGALGISNNIGGLTTSWHMGFNDGAAPLISQNRGAGKYRRTLELFFWLLIVDVMIGVIGLALVSWSLPWLAEVFAQSKDAFDQEFCDMIVAIHQWEMVGYITLGVNSATLSLLLGYGYSKRTMILNVARVFVFRIPVLWFYQNFTSVGVEAVGLTMMISNVSTGIAAAAFAIPTVMEIRRRIREEEQQ